MEELSENIIHRSDGLYHLLYSDVNNLMMSIEHDFPDIAKTYSIGKSFEGRDINVIELTYPSGEKETKKGAKEETNLVQISEPDDIEDSGYTGAQKDKKEETPPL